MDELFDTDEEATTDIDIELEAELTPQASILALRQSYTASVHLVAHLCFKAYTMLCCAYRL